MYNTQHLHELAVKDQIIDYYLHIKSWFTEKYKKSITLNNFSFDDDLWYLPKPYTNNKFILFYFKPFKNFNSNIYDIYLFKAYVTEIFKWNQF